MNVTNFELKFNARRPFTATKRKGYYILGLIEMLVGSVGVFMIEYPLSRFYMILFVGGVFSFLAAVYGKNLIREANTITINPQNVVFKNVSQRAKKVEVENLDDIILKKDRVEFITKERRCQTYDFSIYTESERKDLYKVLNQLKENLG